MSNSEWALLFFILFQALFNFYLFKEIRYVEKLAVSKEVIPGPPGPMGPMGMTGKCMGPCCAKQSTYIMYRSKEQAVGLPEVSMSVSKVEKSRYTTPPVKDCTCSFCEKSRYRDGA